MRAGAPLFQIDARDYRAQVQQAQAAVQRADAARQLGRGRRPLPATGEPPGRQAQEFDAAVASARQADASLSDAKAQLTLARLRLERTTVTAPIAGRVGRAQVTEGALVSAASATLLAQINQLSPIHAVFTQSNTAILDFGEQVREGRVDAAELRHIEVRLILANGREYEEPGQLDFTDLAVDPSTGTQTLRARFGNPARTLLPGQFVRGRIVLAKAGQGIRIPERAVQIEGGTASVALVADDGTMVRRNIALGSQDRGQWTVLDGLKAGERVVVDGWHRVQPGQRVTARPAPVPAASQPGNGSMPR